MVFDNISRFGINLITRRYRKVHKYYKSWPNDWVPFVWNRPVKTPGYLGSGDLVQLETPPEESLHPDFRASKELKSLSIDHPMRKMFSLQHSNFVQLNKIYAQQFIDNLGVIHHVDFSNSLEAKIASLTFSLRQIQDKVIREGETMFTMHERQIANSLKYRRYRYLCDLKELHSDRYNRIIKALKIDPPENKINVEFHRPYRKIQMRRLAQKYARDLKEKKVEEFLKNLEKEKSEFQQYKEETLKWIEEKEAELGMSIN